MAGKNIWIIGILIVGLFLIVYRPSFEFKGAVAENIYRVPLLLERTFAITENSGSIKLPEGTDLDNIRKIEIRINACSASFIGRIEGLEQGVASIGFPACEAQYFKDPNGDKEYVHYLEKSMAYNVEGIDFDEIKYDITEALLPSEHEQVLEKRIVIHELIECDRSSQCVSAAPYCNSITHKCAPKVESCTLEFEPVCGENRITYINACFAALTGASVEKEGKCSPDIVVDVPEPESTSGYSERSSTPSNENWAFMFMIALLLMAGAAVYLSRSR